MTYQSNWRLGALAGAVALLSSFSHLPAHALGLGRITVQSALGEALKAEIEVPEITAEEAGSLRVGLAPPAAFKSAGLEYSQLISSMRITLQKKPDGRSVLSLSSARPMSEPFVDMIIEVSWASGRLVRDYTLLFDPPNLRQAAPAPTAPTVSAAPAFSRPSESGVPQTASAAARGYDAPAVARIPARKQPATPKAVIAEKSSAPSRPASGAQQVTVRAGDTASKIATLTKPVSISLDQMLVALLKSNPDAFISGNINRLKSGAVLDIPSSESAGAMPAAEAARTVVAQSKDFNEFRQKLASGVPATQIESATRQSGGKLQAKVDDRAATAVAPDKLTLSKGAVQATAPAEDKIAREKQAKDATTRVAELSKNIGDLNKLGNTTSATSVPANAASSAKAAGLPIDKPGGMASPVSATSAASANKQGAGTSPAAPASAASASRTSAAPVPVPVPAAVLVPATTALPAATATIPSASVVPVTGSAVLISNSETSTTAATMATIAAPAAAPASASASAALAKKPVVAAPVAEPGFIETLTGSEYVLPTLGVLLALLAGFGIYRYKRRDQGAAVDSSFLESRLQPDSFFGASGGQRIDTSESSSAAGSSMVYSPSQLDAAGDVDPVAEADVYLAYGRDLQAEEILKEALRTHPSRVAIHAKLLEIYAKRRDLKGFEVVAAEAFGLTRGSGPEWAYICEMGRELDSSNPLYQQGGLPPLATSAATAMTPAMLASFGPDTIPQMLVVPSPESPPTARDFAPDVDFDLDLDFSDESTTARSTLDNGASTAKPSLSTTMPPVTGTATDAGALHAQDLANARGLEFDAALAAHSSHSDGRKVAAHSDDVMSFDLDMPETETRTMVPVQQSFDAAAAPKLPAIDSGMLEFDLSSLSLDLDAPVTSSSALPKTEQEPVEGPMEVKFALAEEFRALGDNDGARSLASEVVAQAQGALKIKALAFLNALS